MEKCLWCTTSLEVEGDVAVVAMLRRYSSGKLSRREMDSLNEDLSCCLECVVEYHRARDKVPDLHKVLKHRKQKSSKFTLQSWEQKCF